MKCYNNDCKAYDKDVECNCNRLLSKNLDFCKYYIPEPEKDKYLKTGWVRRNNDGAKLQIMGYHEKDTSKYLLVTGWFTEKHLNENFTPCDSPIGT